TPEDKRRILSALNGAEAFERFLHTKFLGQKRFSLEGAETLIPMLEFLLDAAADAGVEEFVMGMAHRGRLNVLANIVGKSYEQIFREFAGALGPNVPQGSGDAAFAGQGVVAETLNLSELPGYDVGGTVHIVVNNQVGFTTPAGFARSTVYATDIAKAVQAPIFHVNGDDPEAAVRVIRLAYE